MDSRQALKGLKPVSEIDFSSLSSQAVLDLANSLPEGTINPDKARWKTAAAQWHSTLTEAEILKNKHANNKEYIAKLMKTMESNFQLFNQFRDSFKQYYGRVTGKLMAEHQASKSQEATDYPKLREAVEKKLSPDFNSLTPAELLFILKLLPVSSPSEAENREIWRKSLENWKDNFDKFQLMKMQYQYDTEFIKRLEASHVSNLAKFEQTKDDFKQIYGTALGVYTVSKEKEVLEQTDVSGMFEDHEFPPEKWNMEPKYVAVRRPCQLVKNPELFVAGSEANDIKQGQIGDCYFLSSLGSLTTRPKILQRAVLLADTKNGKYVFSIRHKGQVQQVTIDDKLPIDAAGVPIVGRCKDPRELWVSLFEKAYAKLKGGYKAIGHGGRSSEVLCDFAGGEKFIFITKQKFKTVAELWKTLVDYHSRNALITCFSDDGKMGAVQQSGIVDVHSYTILRVVEVEDLGAKHKLIQLRNPWGNGEWKGRFSDYDTAWTPGLIQQLQVTFADDGTFYMCAEDFYNEWEYIEGCFPSGI